MKRLTIMVLAAGAAIIGVYQFVQWINNLAAAFHAANSIGG